MKNNLNNLEFQEVLSKYFIKLLLLLDNVDNYNMDRVTFKGNSLSFKGWISSIYLQHFPDYSAVKLVGGSVSSGSVGNDTSLINNFGMLLCEYFEDVSNGKELGGIPNYTDKVYAPHSWSSQTTNTRVKFVINDVDIENMCTHLDLIIDALELSKI